MMRIFLISSFGTSWIEMVADVGYVGFAQKRRDDPEGALLHKNPNLALGCSA